MTSPVRRALSVACILALAGCDQSGSKSPEFPTPPAGAAAAPPADNTPKTGANAPTSNAAHDSARGGTPPK